MTAQAVHGQWTQPMIPMVNEAGERITLSLRRLTLERELAALPADMQELHKFFIEIRENQNKNVYLAVLVWKKLRCYDKYWTSFGFVSEAEYLAYNDLPDGSTLSAWSVMVNYFDKDTFVLLGDELLRFLLRNIGEYQTDSAIAKKDYQAIFDKYSGIYDAFDKQSFKRVLRQYIEETYIKPELEKQKITREEWNQKKEAKKRKQVHVQRRYVPTQSSRKNANSSQNYDFKWKEEKCPTCVKNEPILMAASKHIRDLEEIIRMHIGKDAVPRRPKSLDGF